MIVRTNISVLLIDVVDNAVFYLFESFQSWGPNERLIVQVCEKEVKGLE